MYLLVRVQEIKRRLVAEVHFDQYEYVKSKCFKFENTYNDLDEAIKAKYKLTNDNDKYVILQTVG